MNADKDTPTIAPVAYEPPRVEQVLTPVDLEHEVLYAGQPTGIGDSDF